MDNTHKDKIAEKAIWENYNPDCDSASASNVVFNQQQMMLCYNCNKAIPDNSKFCPWCQTELFTQCPKCGNKYSSRYPACNQCGTNKEAYFLEQNRLAVQQEEERKRKEWAEYVKNYNKRVQDEIEQQAEKDSKENKMSIMEWILIIIVVGCGWTLVGYTIYGLFTGHL